MAIGTLYLVLCFYAYAVSVIDQPDGLQLQSNADDTSFGEVLPDVSSTPSSLQDFDFGSEVSEVSDRTLSSSETMTAIPSLLDYTGITDLLDFVIIDPEQRREVRNAILADNPLATDRAFKLIKLAVDSSKPNFKLLNSEGMPSDVLVESGRLWEIRVYKAAELCAILRRFPDLASKFTHRFYPTSAKEHQQIKDYASNLYRRIIKE